MPLRWSASLLSIFNVRYSVFDIYFNYKCKMVNIKCKSGWFFYILHSPFYIYNFLFHSRLLAFEQLDQRIDGVIDFFDGIVFAE